MKRSIYFEGIENIQKKPLKLALRVREKAMTFICTP